MALVALAGSPAVAHPFTISVGGGGSATIVSATQSGSGAWTVNIHVESGEQATFALSTDDADTVVDLIEVECDADCLMYVNETGLGTFAEIRSIAEKSTSSPESFEIGTITISGSLGPGTVSAEVIGQIDIDGDLTGAVTTGPRADNSDSDISLIDVGGDLTWRVHALYGRIEQVIVAGVIDGPTVESPAHIWARDGIREIEADAIIDTSILANYDGSSYTSGTISRVEAISGDFSGTLLTTSAFVESGLVADPGLFVAGDFAGGVFLTTGALTCPIVIDGDMLGAIEVWSGGLDHGTNESGDITIYGGMYSDGYLWCGGSDGFIRTLVRIAGDFGNPTDAADIPAKGLYEGSDVGQIIINADPPGGEWQGDVTIDGTLLSPVPAYANEDLIGAVGEVPFRLHDGDCMPENGEAVYPNDGLVVLRFYGPVTWDERFPFNIS